MTRISSNRATVGVMHIAVEAAPTGAKGLDKEAEGGGPVLPKDALTLAVWALPPRSSTVVRARALVRGALTTLGLAADVVDDAVVATSELAANAVRHAHSPFELRLYRVTTELVVEMVDGSSVFPPPPDRPFDVVAELTLADVDAAAEPSQLEGGWGLYVVHQLTRGRCGVRSTTTCTTKTPHPGKAVWFAVDLPDALAEHVGRRADKPAARGPARPTRKSAVNVERRPRS